MTTIPGTMYSKDWKARRSNSLPEGLYLVESALKTWPSTAILIGVSSFHHARSLHELPSLLVACLRYKAERILSCSDDPRFVMVVVYTLTTESWLQSLLPDKIKDSKYKYSMSLCDDAVQGDEYINVYVEVILKKHECC